METGAYCIVPCESLGEDNVFFGDLRGAFSHVVFKNIDQLSRNHLDAFFKFWEEYRGNIITTFSTESILDFRQRDLYERLKGGITDLPSYFTHEGTHALAQDILQPKEEGGPDGVLVEGLAVWASDGHYSEEPIDEWAAIVAASDEYLSLSELRAGPFYDFQHETSYLESGSFVKFLVGRYGLDTLKELYGRATGDAGHDEALVQSLGAVI